VPPTATPVQLLTETFPGIPVICLDHPNYAAGAPGSVWFRARVNDSGDCAKLVDGADVTSVRFLITDKNGAVVSDQTEKKAAYCAFSGDDPNCPAWVFAAHGNKWPKGQAVQSGQTYTLTVTASSSKGTNDNTSNVFTFNVKL